MRNLPLSLPRPSGADQTTLVEAALRIGQRVMREAIWSDAACTWEIPGFAVGPAGYETRIQLAQGDVYSGSAGIALFLCDLWRLTGDPDVLRTLRGSLAHATAQAEAMAPNSFGFFSGRVGVIWTLVRAAHILSSDEYRAAAIRLLQPMHGHEHNDFGLDVIAGAAGAIPALLELEPDLPDAGVLDMCEKLGDRLTRGLVREVVGAALPTSMLSERYLTGFAHGAAGVGYALLELFSVIPRAHFLIGASEAVAYERHFFDPAQANWPDFRHSALSELRDTLGWGEILERKRAGQTIPFGNRTYMMAWCHGAPGIGLARLRAWRLLRDGSLASEVRLAAQRVFDDDRIDASHCLCHGLFGNLELLRRIAVEFDRPDMQQAVEQRTLSACERYGTGETHWKSGARGGAPDVSLLKGDAGVGVFLIALAGGDEITLLAPRTQRDTLASAAPDGEMLARLAEELRIRFPKTLAALGDVREKVVNAVATHGFHFGSSVADQLRSRLEAQVQRLGANESSPALRSAFACEAAALDLLHAPWDYAKEQLEAESRRRYPLGTLQPDDIMQRRPGTALLSAQLSTRAPSDESDAATSTLLLRREHRVIAERLSPLADVILSSVDGSSYAAILQRVVDQVEVDGSQRDALDKVITDQLRELHNAMVIDVQPTRDDSTLSRVR